MIPLPPRQTPYFPPGMPGAQRVAYLLAGALEQTSPVTSPYVEDRGDGEFCIDGTFDLAAAIKALLAAAPPETPLWWNDGPILDAASKAVEGFFPAPRGTSAQDIAPEIAKAVLQVAHRAGYAPCAPVPADMSDAAILERVGKALDADGWIEWSGGDNPELSAEVEYQMRDTEASPGKGRANQLRWSHLGYGGDIMRYRLALDAKAGPSDT